MRRTLSRLGLLVALLAASAAQATTTFELTPQSGLVTGSPGATVGWGFTLTNDEDFLVVSSAEFRTGAGLGTFTDFISARNFFVVGNAPNTSTVWAQRFDPTAQTGVGSFAIDPSASVGSTLPGTISISYDLYARSPLDPAFDPDHDTLKLGQTLTAFASVAVIPVPEPASWMGLLVGIATLVGLHHTGESRRRRVERLDGFNGRSQWISLSTPPA